MMALEQWNKREWSSWCIRIWENDIETRKRCQRAHQSSTAIKIAHWYSTIKDWRLRKRLIKR